MCVVCVCACVCMCVRVHVYACACVCRVCICVCACACVCVYMRVRMHVCVYVYMCCVHCVGLHTCLVIGCIQRGIVCQLYDIQYNAHNVQYTLLSMVLQ